MRDPRDANEDDRTDAPAGLFLSRKGNWFHDGQRVGHLRLEALLTGAVSRDDAGGLIVTTGRDVLPFVAEDAPLFVISVDFAAVPVELVLSDGKREPLTGIVIGPDDRFRAAVHGGRFWALFIRSAAQLLEPHFGDDDGLVVNGQPCGVTALALTTWSQPPANSLANSLANSPTKSPPDSTTT